MIGRADIEGSKSNVAMNAWLPQASSVIPADLGVCTDRFSTLCRLVGDRTLSGGRSPYLKHAESTPTSYRALNRPALSNRQVSQVSCGLSLFSRFLPVCPEQTLWLGVTRPLGTEDLTRVPRIQMCCSTEGTFNSLLTAAHTASATAELDPNQASGPGTIVA